METFDEFFFYIGIKIQQNGRRHRQQKSWESVAYLIDNDTAERERNMSVVGKRLQNVEQ